MATFPIVTAAGEPAAAYVDREARLQRALIAYIVAGLLFMLLPGTFLGVWNLISAAGQQDPGSLRPAWLQAHGHAQIFGWIGTFILGIGFYSLSKMGQLPAYAVRRAWWAFVLWTAGVLGRWFAGVSEWQWQMLLPVSSALELAAFLIFFRTVSGHRASKGKDSRKPEAWMLMVIASTLGFLFSLLLNLAATLQLAWLGTGPALPHASGQMLVALQTWGFLAPAIWGFNARWLPVFLGLGAPRIVPLFGALAAAWFSLVAGFFHQSAVSAAALPVAAGCAIAGLRVWERAVQSAKTQGCIEVSRILSGSPTCGCW